MASPKQKFDAAIKVIHSLPKEGPFQPSNEMMLTFYGFFKQATEGKCKLPKPNFWEIVKKAKWDAWHKLGDMNQEEAMLNYVEELKKTLKICSAKWSEMAKKDDPRIVEAMPQTQVVGDFVDSLGTFYELVDEEPPAELNLHREKNGPNNNSEQDLDDVEAAVMNMSAKVESALKTFSHFEDESDRLEDMAGLHDDPLANGDLVPGEERKSRSDSQTNHSIQSSDSEDEFCDTSDRPEQTVEEVIKVKKQEVQMSTPLKKETSKSNHVHFSDTTKNDVNGRISPIMPDHVNENYVQLSRGFPHISGKVNGQISDSMLVNAPEGSNGTASTLSDLSSQNDFSMMDYSSNNSNVIIPVGMTERGGEENEPPGATGGGDRGRGGDRKPAESSRPTRRAGSSASRISGSYSSRTALLAGGGAGGGSGGEDNPAHSQPIPQDAMNEPITLILVRLQQDMNSVLDRLNRLETRVTDTQRQTETRRTSDMFSWWPFQNRTGRTAFFILVWPIIVHILISYLFRRRRRQT